MKKVLSMMIAVAMLVCCMFVPAETAYAANISISVSSASVQIGDTFTATVTVPDNVSGTVDLTFSSNVLTFMKASAEVNTNGETVSISMGKYGLAAAKSVTVTFKAKTSGEAKIQASGIDLYDHEDLVDVTLGSASVNVTIANQTVEEPVKSGDNSLSSLKLSSGTLSPKFQYNVTKYTATVGYDTKSVVVSAKASNPNAVIESVTGNGMVKLNVGENPIEVVVRAENGVKATYEVIVIREAKQVEVTPQPSETPSQPSETPQPSESESEITSESESVVTGLEDILHWNNEQLQLPLEIPAEIISADFEKTPLFINGTTVEGLAYKNGGLKVLYLINATETGSFYVFEELQQTIYPLIRLNAENSYVFVLVPNEEETPVPEGFVKCTLSIEGKGMVTAYQLEQNQSDFYLIYGMNHKGETGWYLYDIAEQTFQRYLKMTHLEEVSEEIEPTEESMTEITNTEDNVLTDSDAEADVVTDGDANANGEYEKMQKELADAKKLQGILIISCGVLGIAFLITLILFLKQNRESAINK